MTTSAEVNYLKSGHTISLNSHRTDNADFVRSRSSQVLLSRGSSYPVLPADLSIEYTAENLKRRAVHRDIMTADPAAFRRKAIPEGTSSMLNEKHRIKDYLTDIHKLKDMRDINNNTRERLTFSRRSEQDRLERTTHDEYKYNTLKPIEDFLRPEATESLRQTGYEHGHVRSLLKLDVFGPASSMQAAQERAMGKIPPSPNKDRFLVSEPSRVNSQVNSRINSPVSRASTASSFDSYEFTPVRDKGKNTMAKRSLRFSSAPLSSSGRVDMSQMHDMFHQSSNPIGATSTLNSNKFNATDGSQRIAPGTLGYHGPALTTEDRLCLDPLLKRTQWSKAYMKGEQDKKIALKMVQKENKMRRQQQQLAEAERKAMRDFERHLVLARIQA